MLALDKIESGTFEPLLGQIFHLVADNASRELELIKVTANERLRRDNGRVPFALLFRSADGDCLPQRIYRIEHAQLGPMELFIVPVMRDGGGFCYEAIFH